MTPAAAKLPRPTPAQRRQHQRVRHWLRQAAAGLLVLGGSAADLQLLAELAEFSGVPGVRSGVAIGRKPAPLLKFRNSGVPELNLHGIDGPAPSAHGF